MMKKIKNFSPKLFSLTLKCTVLVAVGFCCGVHAEKKPLSESVSEMIPEESIWDSNPEEISEAKVQILDKISGKVFREKITQGKSFEFGTIRLTLKRIFKNSPDDEREIYAYVEIEENGKIIFSDWLFASAPAVNLFKHAIYDVRIEF